jgi:pimeloyl-ACP methyl ester carboxylesterase
MWARMPPRVAGEAGVGRFAVWGVGGGGPHALACAAVLPGRVLAAAVAEPVAPIDAPGLDWFAGMAAGNTGSSPWRSLAARGCRRR